MVTTKSLEISAPNGGAFNTYLAIPECGSGPGLIILQEIFGINESDRKSVV